MFTAQLLKLDTPVVSMKGFGVYVPRESGCDGAASR